MKILLMLPYCSSITYEKVFTDITQRTNQQFHKYYRLVTEGLIANGVEVSVGCSFEVNNINCPQRIIRIGDEVVEGVAFHYFITVNLRILGRVIKCFQSAFFTFNYCIRNRDAVVFCDPNKVAIACGAIAGARLAGRPVIYNLGDLPSINTESVGQKQTFRSKFADRLIDKADGYLFVTEAENTMLNHNSKPYVVIEGIVDDKLSRLENVFENKYPKRVMLYTGGIVRHYGLEQLIEAFSKKLNPEVLLLALSAWGTLVFR